MKLDRRDFLSLAGGAVGGAALGRVTLKGLGRLNEALAPEMAAYPGEEKQVRSICRACSGGCGLRVRTVGGRAVKVDGDPLYPVNRGGVCPRAQALLQWVYHPDRILTPRRRGKLPEPWEAVSWEAALDTVAGALQKLRTEHRANRLVAVSGRGAGIPQQLLSRFLSLYGGHPLLGLPTGMETSQTALQLMAGGYESPARVRLAYDLENARCVLNFGCDLVEGWGTPSHTLWLFGRWRDSSRGRRTSLIHFSPRFSVSAARADEWVPMEVGTWGAVALGLAFVLLTEDLYNREFVENCTFGFDDWTDTDGRRHVGFRTLVREEYRLSRVSELTGIPSETLVRVARLFAAEPGGVAIGPQQSPLQPGRLADAMAIQALNALVGSVGARGGVALVPETGWTLPSPSAEAPLPSRSLEEISEVLAGPVEVLLLDEAAGLLDLLDSAQREALRRIPLIVTTASTEDETTGLAHLVLPDCTPLESWTDGQSPTLYPHDLLALSAPVLPPQGQSRPWGETILALARATDSGLAARFPWKDLAEVFRACADPLAERKTGYLFGNEVDEQWQRLLEHSGWWSPDWTTADELWTGLNEQGGWWNPVSRTAEPQRAFATPSGRFELYSQRLDELLRRKPGGRPAASGASRERDRQVLPHHSELLPPTDPQQFELVLEPYEPLAFFGGGLRTIPFLQQIASPYGSGGSSWQSWVEISAEDARQRDIRNGDWVWVESAKGRIRRRALVLEGAMPGIVGAPQGGAPSTGRWAAQEQPLADILVPMADSVLGVRSHAATRINLHKA